MKNLPTLALAVGVCIATGILAYFSGFQAGALRAGEEASSQIEATEKSLELTYYSLFETAQKLEESNSIVEALMARREISVRGNPIRKPADQESLNQTPAAPAVGGRNLVGAGGRVVASLSSSGSELFVPNGVYIPADKKFLLNPQAISGGKVSVPHGERTNISFTNNTDEDLYLFWVDYSGTPTFSDKLTPGKTHAGISSVGQVHVLTNTKGEVYSDISPIGGTDTIDIENQ